MGWRGVRAAFTAGRGRPPGWARTVQEQLLALRHQIGQVDQRVQEMALEIGHVGHVAGTVNQTAAHTEQQVALLRAEVDLAVDRLASLSDEVATGVRTSDASGAERIADLRTLISALAEAESAARAGAAAVVATSLARVSAEVRSVAVTAAAVTEHVASLGLPGAGDDVLVSVVLPTKDRAHVLARALDSLLAQTHRHWECWIVDDDSSDDTADVLAPYLDDNRVQVVRTRGLGASGARNAALAQATGDVIAYLDSDNAWHPHYLRRVVAELTAHPAAVWTVAAELVVGDHERAPGVRDDRGPLTGLLEENLFDLNVVAHRRDALGGTLRFDESLRRFGDWDLVLRLAQSAGPPRRIAALGATYWADEPGRVTRAEPGNPARARLRARALARSGAGLRVLAAEWHYPQLTESYMHGDLLGLSRLGVHVEVWSERRPRAPHATDLRQHHGSLDEALDDVRPDLVLTHWVNVAQSYAAPVHRRGLPFAVRAHGFEVSADALLNLAGRPRTLLHLHAHHADLVGPALPRSVVTPVAFDSVAHAPRRDKDRRLVVRLAAGLSSKDLGTFLDVAGLCPEHRFVLAVGHCADAEAALDDILEANRRAGSPAEILVDVPHDEAAALKARAGIHLHTADADVPVGAPVSIPECAATGAVTIVRNLPPLVAHAGPTALTYGDAKEAARLVTDTLRWTDSEWADAWHGSVEHAWAHHADTEVAATLLSQWAEHLGVHA